MQETRGPLGGGDPLEEGMATRSSILAWRSPRTEEPGEPHTIHGVPKSQTRLSAHYREMMGVGFWKIPQSLPLSETSTFLQGGEPREVSSALGKGGSEWGWGRGWSPASQHRPQGPSPSPESRQGLEHAHSV